MPSERDISRILAARVGGECEVKTPVGFIDVLSPKILYEVKEARGWKGALGQVLAYGRSYPDRKLCLYLYGEATAIQKRLIKGHCEAVGVAVEWHREPRPDEPPPVRVVTPVADGMKLSLSALDHSYRIKAGFNVHLVTPTEAISRERLDAYMEEALSVFDALLDNELTLTLHYSFGGEQLKLSRTRPSVLGEPVMYRFNLTIMTKNTKTISTSLPGMRTTLPSGQRLIKQANYYRSEQIPEISRLRNFILHPEFRWASQLNVPASSLVKATWQFVKR